MPQDKADIEAAIDIEDAAARLGLDVETLERALDRGLLAGFQTPEGRWKVFLDPQEPRSTPTTEPALGPSPEQSAAGPPPSPRRDPALLAEIEQLRALLQRREQELQEKDRLIAELARSLARLGEAAVDRLRPDGRAARAAAAPEPAQPRDLDYAAAIDNIRHTLRLVRNYLVQQKRQLPDDADDG